MHGLFTLLANDRLGSLIFRRGAAEIDRIGSDLSSLTPYSRKLADWPCSSRPAARCLFRVSLTSSGRQRGEGARSMEIGAGVEPAAAEGAAGRCGRRWQELIAHPLTHDRAVLRFRQGVVGAVSGGRHGELAAQLRRQSCRARRLMSRRTVVGREAADGEGELFQEVFGQRGGVADPLDAAGQAPVMACLRPSS